MRKTAIVVPCYNEARRLRPEAFLDATRGDRNLHFIFVNDASSDDTLRVIREMAEKNPKQISFMSLEKNSGKAEAVRRGFLMAFEKGYENIGYWDADLATPLEEIEKFCRILDETGATLVMGSRVRLLGREIERRPARHYLGRLFATFVSLMLGLPVYDTQCGAKVFRNTPALEAAMKKPFRVKWTFDVELLARLIIIGRQRGETDGGDWVEHPLTRWRDVEGSKIKKRDFARGIVEYSKIFVYLYAPWIRDGYRRFVTENDVKESIREKGRK